MEKIIFPQSCNGGGLSYQMKFFLSVKQVQIVIFVIIFENDTCFFWL